MKLLVVCTANICRSPMAAAAMKHLLHERDLHAEVSSAGVHALPDQPAHPQSIATVARAGLGDLTNHRSREVSRLLLDRTDLVFCMEERQRTALVALSPQAAGRIRLLGYWRGIEISDPVNGTEEGFEECLETMNDCAAQWIDRLARQGLLR